MAEIRVHKSSGNVFADIGFAPAEAAELTVKSRLISAIDETIKRRKLTAARGSPALRDGSAYSVQSPPWADGERDNRPADGLAYRTRPYRRNSHTSLSIESEKGSRRDRAVQNN